MPRHYSDAIIRKVSDGDFHNVMGQVGFRKLPRDEVTIDDMIHNYNRAEYIRRMQEEDSLNHPFNRAMGMVEDPHVLPYAVMDISARRELFDETITEIVKESRKGDEWGYRR